MREEVRPPDEALLAEVERLRQENTQLRRELTFDKLTGFYKEDAARSKILQILRKYFVDQNNPLSVSLILMDFDGLREINNRYSHEVGNAAIKRFSEFIREDIISFLSARGYPIQGFEEPFFAFRSFERGDEFGLVLCGVGEEEARKITLDLQSTPLAFEFEVARGKKKSERVSYSVGVSSTSDEEIALIGQRKNLIPDGKARAIYETLKRKAGEEERINKRERKNG